MQRGIAADGEVQSDGAFNALALRFLRINRFNARDGAADLQIPSLRSFLRTDVRGDSDRRIRISADRDRPRRTHGSNWLFREWRCALFPLHPPPPPPGPLGAAPPRRHPSFPS